MAARSEGIFPREGFNLDNVFEVTTDAQLSPVSFTSIRTLRLIVVGLNVTEPTGDGLEASLTVLIGSRSFNIDFDKVDPNGVYIEHIRGNQQSPNATQYILTQGFPNSGTGGTASLDGVFIELVDGPAH